MQFLIPQTALGLICGEVGVDKTCTDRAAVAGLDRSHHTISTQYGQRRRKRAGSSG